MRDIVRWLLRWPAAVLGVEVEKPGDVCLSHEKTAVALVSCAVHTSVHVDVEKRGSVVLGVSNAC